MAFDLLDDPLEPLALWLVDLEGLFCPVKLPCVCLEDLWGSVCVTRWLLVVGLPDPPQSLPWIPQSCPAPARPRTGDLPHDPDRPVASHTKTT